MVGDASKTKVNLWRREKKKRRGRRAPAVIKAHERHGPMNQIRVKVRENESRRENPTTEAGGQRLWKPTAMASPAGHRQKGQTTEKGIPNEPEKRRGIARKRFI